MSLLPIATPPESRVITADTYSGACSSSSSSSVGIAPKRVISDPLEREFENLFPHTYIRLKTLPDTSWEEQHQLWHRVDENLRNQIYESDTIDPSQTCPSTYQPMESACYGSTLLTHDTSGPENLLLLQNILTGETIREIRTPFFTIKDNLLYTAPVGDKPILEVWDLEGGTDHTLTIEPSEKREQIEYMLQNLYFYRDAPIAIFKMLPPVIGSSSDISKREYLIGNIKTGQSLILPETDTSIESFFLSEQTLFAVSRSNIIGIAVDDKFEIKEKYNGIDTFTAENLHQHEDTSYECHAIEKYFFIKCKNILYTIDRTSAVVNITKHKDVDVSLSNSSFLEMPTGMLLIKLDERVELWDVSRNEKIESPLTLKAPTSLLRYEAGVLYEVNGDSISIWDSTKIQPLKEIPIGPLRSHTSAQNVNLTLFDNKLFIQVTGIDEVDNHLLIYSYPSMDMLISLSGVLMSDLPGHSSKESSISKRTFRPCWPSRFNQLLPFFRNGALTLKSSDEEILTRYDFSIISTNKCVGVTEALCTTDTSNTIAPIIGIGIGGIALIALGFFTFKK